MARPRGTVVFGKRAISCYNQTVTTKAQTPFSVSDVPSRVSAARHFALPRLGELWRTQRHWLLLVIPLMLTLWGPLRWVFAGWRSTSEATAFQMFVPLGVLYLAWTERDSVAAVYSGLAEMYTGNSKARSGTPALVYLGCAVLFFAYLVTVATFAFIGFYLVLVGILLYLYGFTVLRSLWRPLAFGLLGIPPPPSATENMIGILEQWCAFGASGILKLKDPAAHALGRFVSIGGYTTEVNGPAGGVGVLVPVLALTVLLSLLRKIRLPIALILLACSAAISLMVATLRVVVTALVGLQNEPLAQALHDIPSWIFAAFAFYLTFLLVNRIAPRRFGGDVETDSDDFRSEFDDNGSDEFDEE